MSNFIAVAVALLAWAHVPCAHGEELVVAVKRVLSGDALTVHLSPGLAQVRISGIVAPERHSAYGKESIRNLERFTKGRNVRLDCFAVDKERRKICRAYVGETDLGLAQIRSGMARWDRASAGEQTEADRMAYEAAEAQVEARRPRP